ncbi:probable carbohydrate esterase At4g34215 isoform X2 [Prunus dulcis]|uniref:probable carbohydrate esterase At4g34215 isoform X2 n=1 Tax=Prunus dulcis TaxID=3755 RepID=UPI001482B373|nr:probable carbohydrate esterase At4g34215 isoform X2 [Prunus dulcis]
MDRRKALQMLMFDSDSDDIWHENVTKAVIAHVTLLKACHDANRRSARKRHRRNRRPLAAVGPTGTGYDSCVISDAGTSFKAKNKNRKKKKSLSPQPNNPPATESLGILAREEELANNRRRKRRRLARGVITRPIGDTGPTHTGSPSPSLISDARTPFKPNKIKNNPISPQPNTHAHPPKMESQSLQPKQIFILSGQSNMAGRGGVFRDDHHHQHWDRVVPNECGPHPSIHRLSAHLQWEPAREPLHADIDAKVCGVGPGMAFANGVRERVGVLGLVPCAVGGTAIKEWARGEHLYESMLKRARESVKGGGEMKGLLWYQGESDTSTQHDADAYHGNMVKLIENVREDLGLPSLPIIQVAIGSGDAKYIEKVREAQLGMNVPNVVCVDAKGLELKDDHLHLTTKAQVQLGHMLADAYIKHFV